MGGQNEWLPTLPHFLRSAREGDSEIVSLPISQDPVQRFSRFFVAYSIDRVSTAVIPATLAIVGVLRAHLRLAIDLLRGAAG